MLMEGVPRHFSTQQDTALLCKRFRLPTPPPATLPMAAGPNISPQLALAVMYDDGPGLDPWRGRVL